MRGGRTAAPLYLVGLLLTLIFVMVCVNLTAWVQKQLDGTKPVVALLAVISPIFASIAAVGFILLVGGHVNMLMLISPFLVLAIGIGRFECIYFPHIMHTLFSFACSALTTRIAWLKIGDFLSDSGSHCDSGS